MAMSCKRLKKIHRRSWVVFNSDAREIPQGQYDSALSASIGGLVIESIMNQYGKATCENVGGGGSMTLDCH